MRAVNELCHGNPSIQTHQLMEYLSRPTNMDTEPVKLFGTNFEVDLVNLETLDALQGEAMVYTSIDTGKQFFITPTCMIVYMLRKVLSRGGSRNF